MTAVEWLEKRLLGIVFLDTEYSTIEYQKRIDKAKEMEKEQQGYSEEDIKKAFCNGADLDYSVLTSTEFGTKILNKWFEQFKNK